MSYEGSDENKAVKTVLAHNQNNSYYNVVSNSESHEEAKESLFEGHIEDEFEVTHKITLNPKW